MLDDLAGKRTGERIQILRGRRGLTRPVLAGLVGMSASWLKGIEQGRRLPPRLPVLVKLAEALAVGDIAVLAGTDMDIGGADSVPVASFARIPHDAVPAIRDAIRDPMLSAGSARRDDVRESGAGRGRVAVLGSGPRHRATAARSLPPPVGDVRLLQRGPACRVDQR
jgi:transcriptional regulator with XRE-family HTH domain